MRTPSLAGGAPICASGSVCQDGDEGDACGGADDCGGGAPICSSGSICQDGDEGDACSQPADCGGGAPICSSSSECQDGGAGDACTSKADCTNGMVCDGTCVACSTVADVDVVIDYTHTWIGDQVFKLVSPDGSVEILMSIAGGNEPSDDGSLTFGQLGVAPNIDGPVTFDDDAAVSSELMGDGLGDDEVICVDSPGCEFYSSGFPDTALNLTNFNGENGPGDWTLCVADAYEFDTATLNAWQLVLTCDTGSGTVDSGPLGLAVPDDTYDGTQGSMTCSSVTF